MTRNVGHTQQEAYMDENKAEYIALDATIVNRRDCRPPRRKGEPTNGRTMLKIISVRPSVYLIFNEFKGGNRSDG